MPSFGKDFVYVEWLAVKKAVDLLREAGFDDSHFVSTSRLIGDEGLAPLIAEQGRQLYDEGGQPAKFEELQPADLGLSDEIDDFTRRPEGGSVVYNEKYFIKRTYEFTVYQRGEKTSYVMVYVSFAKQTEKDDWKVVLESVTDQRRNGNDRWVIYRPDKQSKD